MDSPPPQQSQTIDLSLSLPVPSSSANTSITAAAVDNKADGKLFPCLFCNKKFLKSQALGGHQNAHKKERSTGLVSHLLYQTPSSFTPPFPIASHSVRPLAAGAGSSSFGAAPRFSPHLPYMGVGVVGGGSWWSCAPESTVDLLNWQRGSYAQRPPVEHDVSSNAASSNASCDGEGGEEMKQLDLTLRL